MEQYSIIDTDINHNIMYPLVSGGALPEQYSLHSIIRFSVHLSSWNFDFHHFCQLGSISLEMVKISKLWSHHFLGKGKSTKSWGNYKRYFSFDWGWFTDENVILSIDICTEQSQQHCCVLLDAVCCQHWSLRVD